MQDHNSRFILFALALGAMACSDAATMPPTTPPAVSVAGSYHATTLTITTGDFTINELAQGISLTLTLARDGSIAGRFTVVDVEGELGALDLHGTWTQDDTTVSVLDNANAIAGFTPLRIVGHQLVGESTTSESTTHLVLSR